MTTEQEEPIASCSLEVKLDQQIANARQVVGEFAAGRGDEAKMCRATENVQVLAIAASKAGDGIWTKARSDSVEALLKKALDVHQSLANERCMVAAEFRKKCDEAEALLAGLSGECSDSQKRLVGTLEEFLKKSREAHAVLAKLIEDPTVYSYRLSHRYRSLVPHFIPEEQAVCAAAPPPVSKAA